MNQHETLPGSRPEAGRPESYGETAEGPRPESQCPGIGGCQGGPAGGHEGHGELPEPAGDDISQYVRDQPLPALVIAAALGYFIGRWAMPRRSVAAMSHVAGARWPPRFQSGVQLPPVTVPP